MVIIDCVVLQVCPPYGLRAQCTGRRCAGSMAMHGCTPDHAKPKPGASCAHLRCERNIFFALLRTDLPIVQLSEEPSRSLLNSEASLKPL